MIKAFLVGLLGLIGWVFNLITVLGFVLILGGAALYGYGSHKFGSHKFDGKDVSSY